jgi:hypothetical protein
MKSNTAIFTALAVSITSIQAAPSGGLIYTVPSNPFVQCMRRSFPSFPITGGPSKEEVRACLNGSQTHEKRGLESIATTDVHDSLLSRDLGLIDILGEKMGINQKAHCLDDKDKPIPLHDEFVWPENVISAASGLCDTAMKTIEQTGIDNDGGVAWASKELSNAFDEQSNYLHHKGRQLLVTMAIDYIPPFATSRDSIQAIAKGVRELCSSAVVRLMDGRDGCTETVTWYDSGSVKWRSHLAAKGGAIGMFFGGAKDTVAKIQLGFSEDED